MSLDTLPTKEALTYEKIPLKSAEHRKKLFKTIARFILPITIFLHALIALCCLFLIVLAIYSFIGTAVPFISQNLAISMICCSLLTLCLSSIFFIQFVKKNRILGLIIMAAMVFLVVVSIIFMAVLDVVKKDVLEYLSKSWDACPLKGRVDYQKTFNCCGFANKRDRPAKNVCPSKAVNGCWGYQWNYLVSNKLEIFLVVFGFIFLEVLNFFSVYFYTIIN